MQHVLSPTTNCEFEKSSSAVFGSGKNYNYTFSSSHYIKPLGSLRLGWHRGWRIRPMCIVLSYRIVLFSRASLAVVRESFGRALENTGQVFAVSYLIFKSNLETPSAYSLQPHFDFLDVSDFNRTSQFFNSVSRKSYINWIMPCTTLQPKNEFRYDEQQFQNSLPASSFSQIWVKLECNWDIYLTSSGNSSLTSDKIREVFPTPAETEQLYI